MTTTWDGTLGFLLAPILVGYETERVVGAPVGLSECQAGVRGSVAADKRHTFKGFPVQFSHTSPHRMFNALMRSKMAIEIIECIGDVVRHGIRVKIVPYPEDVCAVWLMIAVKYRPVE